jgi:hypothetical protein
MKYLVPLAILLTMTACASRPDDIEPQYVSPQRFLNMSCLQLETEMQEVNARVSQLHGALDDNADGDVALTAVGVVLFWPALFFTEGDGAEAAEYSRLRGEAIALDDAYRQNACGTVPAQATGTQTVDVPVR